MSHALPLRLGDASFCMTTEKKKAAALTGAGTMPSANRHQSSKIREKRHGKAGGGGEKLAAAERITQPQFKAQGGR